MPGIGTQYRSLVAASVRGPQELGFMLRDLRHRALNPSIQGTCDSSSVTVVMGEGLRACSQCPWCSVLLDGARLIDVAETSLRVALLKQEVHVKYQGVLERKFLLCRPV